MASATFYPSLDGRVANAGVSDIWSTTRDATNGNDANYTDDGSAVSFVVCGRNGGAGQFNIQRGFLLFDTSSLGASTTVSAATITLYVWDKLNGENDGDDFIVLVSSNPASNSALVTEDFDQLGTTEFSDRIDIGSMSTPTEVTFTLNAAGIAAINTTGISKFGAREGHDLLDSAYAGSAGTWNLINIYFSERTGTTNDPRLEVTYTSTSIKSWNGLADASVKSYNGLARASIKSFNGLA